ncbi:helix-turn-helix domain-containing protein [Mycolicibacterium aubagnense]|uniref:helix-turn-helix domain-containing protein n=1 Tax=Mycolicibacterium aubagnense TaxID=319707 RepID=UPI0010FE9F6F|nr:helix-turn-helix domain-containing protein [Mycolicibacterium aubagnense]
MTPDQTHRRVRRLLWSLLAFATTASVSGNITRAVSMHAGVSAIGPIVAAALAPVALLGLTHLLGLWSHIAARGMTYWAFLVAIVVLATAAFRLSFDALRELAVSYGYARFDAALFPLILDGLVAVCTLGLVALTRIEVGAVTQPMTHPAAEMHRGDALLHRADSTLTQTVPDTEPAATLRNRGETVMTKAATQISAADALLRHDGPSVTRPGQMVTQPGPAVTHPDAAPDASNSHARNGDARAAQSVTQPDAADAPGAPPRHDAATAVHLTQPVTQWPQRRDAPLRQAAAASSERAARERGVWPSDADTDPSLRTPRLVEVAHSEHAALADQLIGAGRTTAPAETVRAVLEHAASGASSRTIAEALGVSPSSVLRIVKAARELSPSGAA